MTSSATVMMNCMTSWSIELVQGIEAVSDLNRVKYGQSALLWIHLGVVGLGELGRGVINDDR